MMCDVMATNHPCLNAAMEAVVVAVIMIWPVLFVQSVSFTRLTNLCSVQTCFATSA